MDKHNLIQILLFDKLQHQKFIKDAELLKHVCISVRASFDGIWQPQIYVKVGEGVRPCITEGTSEDLK